jgi:hypothetical protein
MTYPPEWPAPGKMHFRLLHDRLGRLDLDCDHGYVVTAYDLGFPDIRNVSINNSLDHGTFDVTRFFGARAVSLDVTLKPHTGLTPASSKIAPESMLRDKLTGYLYPGIRPTLVFSEHGDNRVRQILLRGDSASFAVSRPDYNELNVSWIAPRGTFYSYDERCYLFRFGETSGEFMDLTIVNEGTVPVDWRASVSGWSIHPKLTLNGTETLSVEYDAEPGDVIILDSYSRTITINGVPASYTYAGDASHWFQIPPGISTLRVEHKGGVSAFGYPYARWQEPATGAGFDDAFERPDGPLGPNWTTPSSIPDGTVAVPLAIDALTDVGYGGAVIVTEPDDGTDPHEWGFARNVTNVGGTLGSYAEMDVANLAQSSVYGPIVRSKAELYTNMNAADAACQALSVDFDYGILATPVDPVVVEEPFETLDAWEIVGTNASIVWGRHGQGAQLVGTSTSLRRDLPPVTVVVAGIAFKIVAGIGVTSVSSVRNLLEFYGADGSVFLGRVAVDVGGSLYATDRFGVNKGGSPVGAVSPNVWHYAEVRYVIDNTIGEFALRLDGVDVAGAYDIATGGAGTVDQIRLPAPNTTSGGTHIYDDLYVAVGADAAFLGPQTVANGSLAWELHQYDPDGTWSHTAAAGTLAYNYDVGTKLRLESTTAGEQRFLLDGAPIVEVVDDSPVVGTLAGFGLNYETFEYEIAGGDFTDDFERAALGGDWTLPVPRISGRTVVLPTISTGAAVTAAHSGSYPQLSSAPTSSGATLAGGVLLTQPSSVSAGTLLIGHVLQENPNGVPLTASPGWTQLGTASQGTPGGDFLEAFDNFGAWTTAGTTAIVTAGRTATNGARMTGAGSSNHADYTLPTASDTVIVGFAHQINSLAAATSEIVQFYSDTNVTQHNRLTVATNGSLSFWRGTTSLATSAAGVIAINTWNYIEVRAVLSDTVGAFEVRVNGTAVIGPLTAQDTKNAGTATVYDTVRLLGPIASFFNTFDDCYVLTGGAAAFKGNQTIAVSSGIEFIRMSTWARLADGTSNDALTVTGAATPYVAGMESFYPPNPFVFPTDSVANMRFASATGNTGQVDPPPITLPTTKDWVFIHVGGIDCQTFPSLSASSGYSTLHSTTTSPTSQCALRAGYRQASLSGVEDPAAWTSSTTNRPWIAMTIGFPGGDQKWGGAEHVTHEFDATHPITVQAVVNMPGTSGTPMVELYSHMVAGSSACRALQVELIGRTWRMGHYDAANSYVIAASGSLPAGAVPFTLRLEGDPDGTERFLFNGTLVQSVLDAGAPNPTTVGVRVGFGEFWTTQASSPGPQIREFSATGARYLTGPPPPEPASPRIERFQGGPLAGTAWAIPGRVILSYDPTKPRPDAPTITGPPEFDAGVADSPFGAVLVEFISGGKGLAIYDDGFVYDGKGWRGPSGDATDWAGGQLGPSTTDPQRPRHDAPNVMEDELPSVSPKGAPIKDLVAPDGELYYAIYNDGYSFDGRGWRNSVGQATYDDGVVVAKAPVDVFPPNNPPPGGKPPWAWTPPVDPLTGEPSILTVHFCFYDQWI